MVWGWLKKFVPLADEIAGGIKKIIKKPSRQKKVLDEIKKSIIALYKKQFGSMNRDVALKVLPQVFAKDTERMARFEREAQVLASLNHPHIAQIHGLEDSEDLWATGLWLDEDVAASGRSEVFVTYVWGWGMPPVSGWSLLRGCLLFHLVIS